MRVCHIVPSLEDRHGGPSKSVRALANAMAAAGAPTDLLTTLEAGQAMQTGGDRAQVQVFPRGFPRALCPSTGLAAHLAQASYDCVHHHALWLRTLHYAHQTVRRLARPLVISPRGMMSGWAYRHRRVRKRLAELLVHPGAFAGAAGWHATSAEEADDIRRLGFKQPICVSPNAVALPSAEALAEARAAWVRLCPAVGARPVALFYSRYHRKKRVRELIELWASRPRGDWFLLLAGVPEDYAVDEVAGWLANAGLAGHAAVFDGRSVPPPFALASLFLLPSHSENFGLVIAEALAAGVPALVTDTTPWRELAPRGAGDCVAWENYGAALDRLLALTPDELRAAGGRGRQWVAEAFTWERAARLLLDFYRTLPHG